MSNFNCEKCGATCLDTQFGYVTGCEHNPVDNGAIRAVLIRNELLVADVKKLRIALADALRRPMGVHPQSAEGLLTAAEVEAAERRRGDQ